MFRFSKVSIQCGEDIIGIIRDHVKQLAYLFFSERKGTRRSGIVKSSLSSDNLPMCQSGSVSEEDKQTFGMADSGVLATAEAVSLR